MPTDTVRSIMADAQRRREDRRLGLEPVGNHLLVDPRGADDARTARAARHPGPLGPCRRHRAWPDRTGDPARRRVDHIAEPKRRSDV